MTSKLAIAALILAAACGKKADTSAPALSKSDADSVNALVPADFKGKIEFEVGTIVDQLGHHKTTYTAVLPKGWKQGFMPGSLEPSDGNGGFGLGTKLNVGSNCDGDCTAKDWAAVVDKVYYKQFTGGQVPGKVLKDDKQKTSRTLVFQKEPKSEQQGTTAVTSGEKGITIITTWWTEGAKQTYVCHAELAEESMGLQAAFEKACSKITIATITQ